MFDGGDVFGGNDIFPESSAEYEAQAPALPAPGQGAVQGDGRGNYQIPLSSGRGASASPPPPPGAIVIPTGRGGGMPAHTPYQSADGMDGMQWDAMEPQDTSSSGAVRSAGFTALLATAAIGAGVAAGGAWGAAAGLLFAGALANGYRAQKWWDSGDASEKHEAVVSSVFSVASIGVGAYLTYKAIQAKREEG